MKNYFWVIVILGALVGGIAAGLAYKQHQNENIKPNVSDNPGKSKEGQSKIITSLDTPKVKVSKTITSASSKSHQIKPTTISPNKTLLNDLENKSLQDEKMPHKKSVGISIEDSEHVDMHGNKITGFDTGIDVKRSKDVDAKENEIK